MIVRIRWGGIPLLSAVLFAEWEMGCSGDRGEKAIEGLAPLRRGVNVVTGAVLKAAAGDFEGVLAGGVFLAEGEFPFAPGPGYLTGVLG